MRITGIILVLFSLFIAACNKLNTDSYRSKKHDSVATRETAENVTIEYTDSGLLRARIITPQLVAVKNVREPYVEMPKGIKAEFIGDRGKVESYLVSEYGISFTRKKRVVVRRNVRVLNIKCEKLETEELVWDQVKGKIYTDKFVKITTPDQIITGEGMESNQAFTDWEILNVSGTINRKNHDSVPCNEPLMPGSGGNNRH